MPLPTFVDPPRLSSHKFPRSTADALRWERIDGANVAVPRTPARTRLRRAWAFLARRATPDAPARAPEPPPTRADAAPRPPPVAPPLVPPALLRGATTRGRLHDPVLARAPRPLLHDRVVGAAADPRALAPPPPPGPEVDDPLQGVR